MELHILMIIIWLHFVADFVLQTDKMAQNKSKYSEWLLLHVGVYTAPFLIFGWQFAIFNGLMHVLTDFGTSRWTSYLWQKGDRHNFFVVIGLDQAIHITTLILSYKVFCL